MQEPSNMRLYVSTGTQIFTTTQILGCKSTPRHKYMSAGIHEWMSSYKYYVLFVLYSVQLDDKSH